MKKNNWNIILYILVLVVIVGVFLKLLPYLLICGVVIWATVKIYQFFNRTSGKSSNAESSDNNYAYKVEDTTDDVSEIIDVDYKDV
jgi:hypothetical protein